MSAFGQAGFGSTNRRNQLRAQGQLDPYGQQVRSAMQAPTLNIYQTPAAYQQATGQQQAPSQSQPAQQPAAAQPSAPATPAYSTSSSAGTAQPIQPQSQGTPYGQGPSTAPPQALRTTSGMTGTTAAEIAAQYHHAGLPIPQWLSQGVSGMQHNSLKSSYDARYVDPAMWKNASESERMQFLGKKDAKGALIAGPDGNAIVDAWSPERLAELARPTYGPGQDQQPQRGIDYIGNFGDGLRTMNLRPTNPTPPTPQSPASPSPEEAQRNAADQAAQDGWLEEMRRAQLSPAEYAARQRRLTEFQRSGSRDPYVFAGQASKRPGYDQEMARRFTDRQASQQRWQQEQEEFLRNYRPRTFEEWRSAQG